MELIVLFFVLYAIYSVITRVLRAVAASAQPSPPSRELVQSGGLYPGEEITYPFTGVREGAEAVPLPWSGMFFPEEPSAESLRGDPVLAEEAKVDELLRERVELIKSPVEPIPEFKTAFRCPAPRKGAPLLQDSPGLTFFLQREYLPAAVAAAEVLGLPRSKRFVFRRGR